MKKLSLFILNILLIIPFILFYENGGMVAIFMLPIWFIMTVINTACSKKIKEILLYNGILMLFATVGIFVCGQLYFKYVFWDSMGEAGIFLEMIIEVINIIVLTVFECLIKYNDKKPEKI